MPAAHAEAQGCGVPAQRQGGRALHQGGQDLCRRWGRVQEGAGAAAAGGEQVRLGSVRRSRRGAGHRLPVSAQGLDPGDAALSCWHL